MDRRRCELNNLLKEKCMMYNYVLCIVSPTHPSVNELPTPVICDISDIVPPTHPSVNELPTPVICDISDIVPPTHPSVNELPTPVICDISDIVPPTHPSVNELPTPVICDISDIVPPTANEFSTPLISDLSDVGSFSVNNLLIPILSDVSNIADTDVSNIADTEVSNIADTEVSNIADTDCVNTSGGQDDSFVDPPVDISNESENNTFYGTNALYDIRKKYLNNVVIGSPNINSLTNKFDALNEIVKHQVDIVTLVETKLDDTFTEDQFCTEGFSKPYRLDRNRNGGRVMIYVRKDIPSKELKNHKFTKHGEARFIEINLRKSKLLLVGTYHSTHHHYGTNDKYIFEQIGLALELYSNYEKCFLTGDFNVQEEDDSLIEFLDEFNAKNLVKDKTCLKSLDNPSCIDYLLPTATKVLKRQQLCALVCLTSIR